MRFERIDVECREEYREGQEPRGFAYCGVDYRVAEICDRWYEGYVDARRMPMRYFRVRTECGEVFVLRYHELFRAWSILVREGVCST